MQNEGKMINLEVRVLFSIFQGDEDNTKSFLVFFFDPSLCGKGEGGGAAKSDFW